MSDLPSVSVVIPLYNKGPHIARAIQSVLDQTQQDFEVIVIDGGSTDGGPAIVRSIKDGRIHLHEQVGSGVSSARNEGVSHARADFIAFLDADDEWMSDHLETLLRLNKNHPDAGAYATAWLIQTSVAAIKKPNFHAIPGKPWEGLIPNYFRSAEFAFLPELGFSPVWTSAVGVPKRILEEMKGFKTEVWWGEDTDLWGRIALKYPIAFSWDGMSIYHVDATNRISDRTEPVSEHIFAFSAQNALRAGEVPLDMREDLMEYLAIMQIHTARRNIEAGRPDLARGILKECRVKAQHRRILKYQALLWAFIPPSAFIALRNYKRSLKMSTRS